MAKKENVSLTPEGLRLLTVLNYANINNSIDFYQKEVFFTECFEGNDSFLFQALGNIGAYCRRKDLDKDVASIIISNKILADFDSGIQHPFIKDIEDKLNSNNSPYRKMKFISEDQLIWYLEYRAAQTDDDYTKKLIQSYKDSKKGHIQNTLF